MALSKETNITNPSKTVEGASRTATNYITASANDGIKVHDAGDTSTFVQIISGAIDFVRSGASMLKMWLDGNVAKVRVGLENAGHSIFSPDGMEVFTDASTSVAKFGETSRIGQDDTSHVDIDYLGISELDEDDHVFFRASDLRTELDGATQYGLFTDVFYASAGQMAYTLTLSLYDYGLVTVNGDDIPPTSQFYSEITYDQATKRVTFPSGYVTISANDRVSISYYSNDQSLKGMSFGSGIDTSDLGPLSTALGDSAAAHGPASFAHGKDASASGKYSTAEGNESEATAEASHAEGSMTEASDRYAHAEGRETAAKGPAAHAEGWGTEAGVFRSYGYGAHAEGYDTKAVNGYGVHAEGLSSIARGVGAHAEGSHSQASGEGAHAQNYYTLASSNYQTAIGKYNVEDDQGVYAFIIGNGDSSRRRNALAVKWDGTLEANALELANALPVASGGTGQTSLAAARNAMGLGNTTGALPVANGGTGITSYFSMNYVNGSTVSVANNSIQFAKLASFTIQPGKWLVIVGCYAAYAASGSRLFTISEAPTPTSAAGRGITTQVNSAASTCYVPIVWSFNVSAVTTYNVCGWHNSGSALNMSAYVVYIRVA